ncbi:MAG: alpha/beta fold hydrolase [Acidimicrobiia bacterium]
MEAAVVEIDIELADGRILHAYKQDIEAEVHVLWHHGTPNIGAPPQPLFTASARLGLGWFSYDRPGYGGSTPLPGRDVASAAEDAAAVANALEVARFAVVGHSGGGPHALACARLLPDRVTAAVIASGLAPLEAPGLDWFAGMVPSGEASLRSALEGLDAKERYETSGVEYDPEFTASDLVALSGAWSWLDDVVGPAVEAGPGGLIADDIAYVTPWGFNPAEISAPILFMHGGMDRIVPSAHGEWLADRCPRAEFRLLPDDGHISILNSAVSALEWLREQIG